MRRYHRANALPCVALACISACLAATAAVGAETKREVSLAALLKLVHLEDVIEAPVAVALTCRGPGGEPLAGVHVEVVRRETVVESATTDVNGVAFVTLSGPLAREKAFIRLPDPGMPRGTSLDLAATASFSRGAKFRYNGTLLPVRDAPLTMADAGRVGVFRLAGIDEGSARYLLAQLDERDRVMTDLLGVPGPRAAACLSLRKGLAQAAGTPFECVWVTTPAEGSSFLFTFTHERTENLIRSRLPSGPRADPRWLYDGMADLVALRVEEGVGSPEAIRQLEVAITALSALESSGFDLAAWTSLDGKKFPRRRMADMRDEGLLYLASTALLLELLPDRAALRAFTGAATCWPGAMPEACLSSALATLRWPTSDGESILAAYPRERAVSVLQAELQRIRSAANGVLPADR